MSLARVAIEPVLATLQPARLAGLVLVDGGYWVPTVAELEELRQGFRPAAYAAFTERWFEALLVHSRPATRTAVLGALRATPREVFVATIYGSLGYDPRPAVEGYPGPRRVVGAAALDGPTMFQRAIPGIPFVLIEAVSHWIMLDAPEALDAQLEEFLLAIP